MGSGQLWVLLVGEELVENTAGGKMSGTDLVPTTKSLIYSNDARRGKVFGIFGTNLCVSNPVVTASKDFLRFR